MDSIRRNKLQDLINDGAQRVAFHPIIPYHRQALHPLIKEHAQYVSYDKAIVTGLLVCRHCHQIFANARWNKKIIFAHLYQVHKVPRVEESVPKINSEISKEPIAGSSSLKNNLETKVPLSQEVIIIDDDDTSPHMGDCPQKIQPIKKKRGRKPKEIHAQEKIKKGEKKLGKSNAEVKLKRHYTKKRKVAEDAKEKLKFE